MIKIKRWLPIMAILFLSLAFAILFIAGSATYERGVNVVELGSVTADDAWIAGKNWMLPAGGVIVRNIVFTAEGYDGSAGDANMMDTVMCYLYAITFGADTETLAVYDGTNDTLTAGTEYAVMTVQSGADTVKVGDLLIFNYQETDTTSGTLQLNSAIVSFEYDKYK